MLHRPAAVGMRAAEAISTTGHHGMIEAGIVVAIGAVTVAAEVVAVRADNL